MTTKDFFALHGFMDTNAAAAYLGISAQALRLRVHRGTAPPSAKLGGRRLWRKADIDAWINDKFKEDQS